MFRHVVKPVMKGGMMLLKCAGAGVMPRWGGSVSGAKRCVGAKSPGIKTLQQKQPLTHRKDRGKVSSSPCCAAGKIVVENTHLSDKDIKTFTEKYATANTDAEKEQPVADLKKLDADMHKQALFTGISIADQKDVLADLKALAASPECTAKCKQLYIK